MADSAVSFLLDQLSILLQQEHDLLRGIKQEAEYIRGELGHMKAFLRVADAKEDTDPQLKEWVMQVREIAYDTEDVLDTYFFQFAHPHSGIRKIWYSVKHLKARHQIASQIQIIKSRVQDVSQSQQRYRDRFGVMDQRSSYTQTSHDHWFDSQGDALLLEEGEVVGIQKPKKRLLDWILSSNDERVISVVGMGGLGKTTIVKKVYDDASVKAKFDCHVWVTVSASFKTEHLLRNIIKQLVEQGQPNPPQELEAINVDEMKKFVNESLQHKTYIVVLDDVWKIDVWESIRYAFPRSKTQGCIIITTRSSDVGNAACSEINGNVYTLEPLNSEESEELFYKKAFPGNACPLYLKDISQSILKKCNGLPLAIVVIGRLLATKNNFHEEWLMFERNIGIELQGDNLNRITKLLSLSYYHLPYYLKPCFLYLSIFPEDALLHKCIIIRLWIAEGFVQGKQGKTAEEVAEGYLNELLDRSLIQVADTYAGGRPRNFRIHDILRACIISKSREQNIVSTALSEEEIRGYKKIRRMVIHTTFHHTLESYNLKYVRSLLWLENVDSELGCPFLYKILRGGSCKLLKVLDIRGATLDSIPDEVFKLYHLKYLCLRNTNIKTIPKSIKNLLNLETLDLKKSKVTELPIEILKLQKLRHLLVYSYNEGSPDFDWMKGFKAPYQIGQLLLSLQKLCLINADEAEGIKIVKEIGRLTQLRRLGIAKLRREDGKDLCSSLAKLVNLRTLYIFSINETEMMDLDHSLSPCTLPFLSKVILSGCLEKVPQWLPSLHGITQLHLLFSRLRVDPLQHLGVLPNLVSLHLNNFAYEGEGLSFKGTGFQRLKKLALHRLRGLRWVRVEKGSMPLLETLYVTSCKLMERLPEGIEHLSNLQSVWFVDMSGEFMDRIAHQKSKEREKWKLAHAPIVKAFNYVDGNNVKVWL